MDDEDDQRRRKVAAEWKKVDPDQVYDDLPEPYRTINEAIEDVLFGVDESIETLEKQRKSAEHEFGLPQALPTSTLSFAGSVTCTFVEARSSRLAIGTSLGEVAVIDARSREVVASERAPFEEAESTCCVALSADSSYESFYQTLPRPADQAAPKPCPKLLVCGSATPKIFVYGFSRETYGMKLSPACVISVPAPQAAVKKPPTPEVPVGKKGKKDEPPPPPVEVEPAEAEPLPSPIQQLHAKGVSGALWVFVLSFDRTIRAYLCPLGEPEESQSKQEAQTLKAIPDVPEDEEEGGQEAVVGGEEFANAVKIQTPYYCIALPSMVPLPGLREPSLDSITLSVTRLEGAPGRAKQAGNAPTFVFLSSTESNMVFAYCFRSPASSGLDGMSVEVGEAETEAQVKALLAQKPPPIGELKEPSESLSLQPQRRWMLPSKISAVAASASGSNFAVGSVQGSLSLISTASGPTLKTVLDGHYAAVTSLVFHKEEALVSVGADSWIHFYDLRRNALLSRCLLSPPPSPPPASAVVALPFSPLGLAMDTKGNLRLLDILRGEKMAKILCRDPDEEEQGLSDEMVGAEETPACILANPSGFCVVSQSRTLETDEKASLDDPSGTDAVADTLDEQEQKIECQSWLMFFDLTVTCCRLFPGIAARVARGEPVADLLSRLSKEDMAQLPNLEAVAPTQPQLEHGLSTTSLLRRNSTNLSERRTSQVKISGSSTIGGTSTSLGMSNRTLPVAGVDGEVARLTAENLQKINSKRHSVSSVTKAPSALRRSGHGSEAEKSAALRSAVEGVTSAPRQAVPLNWQASVKQSLRRCVEEKTLRQANLVKRMDAIRRELECN